MDTEDIQGSRADEHGPVATRGSPEGMARGVAGHVRLHLYDSGYADLILPAMHEEGPQQIPRDANRWSVVEVSRQRSTESR